MPGYINPLDGHDLTLLQNSESRKDRSCFELRPTSFVDEIYIGSAGR